MSPIPKIIHQMWVGKTGRSVQPPGGYQVHTGSLKSVNPDFQYMLWLDDEINQLMQEEPYHQYWDVYRTMPYPIMKSDMARWVILHKYGGVYSDLDFKGLKPLSGLLALYPNNELILTLEPYNSFSGLNKCCNGFAISIPGHPALMDIVKTIHQRALIRGSKKGFVDVIYTTGPNAVYTALSTYPDFISKWSIPNKFILPNLDVIGTNSEPDYSQAYVRTYWEDGTNWANELVPDMIGLPISTYQWVVTILVLVVLIACLLSGHSRTARL